MAEGDGIFNLYTVNFNVDKPPMSPELVFKFANPLAALGWLLLLASPLIPRAADLFAGLIVPLILSVGYASVMLVNWSSAEGGFSSLPAVAQLMQSPWLLLAGWVHYLAFDLLVGAWQVRVARREAIPHLMTMPCLVLTFLFGPAGYLAFQAMRTARRGLMKPPATAAPVA
jgi:hypothetical protein